MWEYIAVLLIGFWLGVAIFLYISCYWLEEIFDLPSRSRSRSRSPAGAAQGGASGAHAQLKRLVARVVEEAAALPELARYAAEPARLTPTIEASTYEDLLATAILNKVIERYQTENGSGGRSSGIHSASASPSPTPSERSSPRSLPSRHHRDISPPPREDVSDWDDGDVTDDTLELPRRVPFPEFGGDIVHNTENEDRDFDEVSSSDIQAVDGTWEENWLFQKKKIKNAQSVPVPMLVPNSNTDYRVLIGDRDADDTTDLSDNASDVDEDIEYKSDIKRIIDSKHVIGGSIKIEDNFDFEPDSLDVVDGFNEFEKLHKGHEDYKNRVVDAINSEFQDENTKKIQKGNIVAEDLDEINKIVNHEVPKQTKNSEMEKKYIKQNITEHTNGFIENSLEDNDKSVLILGIDSGPLPKAEFALKKEIHRTVVNGHFEDDVEDFNTKKNENDETSEQEKEISLALSNNTSTPSTLSTHQREREYNETIRIPVQRHVDSLRRKHFDDDQQQVPTRDTDKEDLIPGSIAYRERKKWLNYVEMPNNPYSPEAIQKRLSAKSNSSLFDMFTNKNNDTDDTTRDSAENIDVWKQNDVPVKEIIHEKLSLTLSNENITNGTRSMSPSPKILKDMLIEEIPQYKRYGRDYYIKEAKSSCGGRKKNSFSDTSSLSSMHKSTSLDNFETDCASPGLLIQQFHTIAETQQYTKFAVNEHTPESITTTTRNNKSEVMIEYEDANEQSLFAAKPAYIDEETDKRFEEILQSARISDPPSLDVEINKINEEPLKSPTNLSVDNSYISSSSLEDSIKIYNVQTGEIIKSKSEDNISLKHDLVPDKNDNIDIDDKNIPRKTDDALSENRDVDNSTVVVGESIEDKFEPSELDVILSQLPKVKELAKKFVSMENLNEPVKPPQQITRRRKSKENILDLEKTTKHMYMHSLTARSISKEFREELKLSMATPLTVPGGSKDIPEGEEIIKESSRPGSPLPEPGTIKSKLAFFESLKNKLSSK